MTGMQPAARASNNVGCPSLAPRMTKQNLARCKEEISSAYIQFKSIKIFTTLTHEVPSKGRDVLGGPGTDGDTLTL